MARRAENAQAASRLRCTGDVMTTPNTRSNGSDSFLLLLQVSNSSFPTGSFSHSYGLETLIFEGAIHSPASAEQWCRNWLRFGVACGDGIAVVAAFRRTLYSNMDGMDKLVQLVEALKIRREFPGRFRQDRRRLPDRLPRCVQDPRNRPSRHVAQSARHAPASCGRVWGRRSWTRLHRAANHRDVSLEQPVEHRLCRRTASAARANRHSAHPQGSCTSDRSIGRDSALA